MIDREASIMSRKLLMTDRSSHMQQVQLFRHPWMERFTVITPTGFAVTWAMLAPLPIWLAWGSATILMSVLLIASGVAMWVVFEYSMHRYAFHWKPKSKLLQGFVYIMHGNHHDVPNDPLRNLMPPIASIPITAAVWLMLYASSGTAGTWVFVGFLAGYVVYDLLHYACHQWPMKSRIWLPFKKHHMRHHYGSQEGNYAISALFLDRIMRSTVDTMKVTR